MSFFSQIQNNWESIAFYAECIGLSVFFAFLAQLFSDKVSVYSVGPLEKNGKRPNTLFIILSLAVMVLVSYFRDGVGVDYFTYFEIFEWAGGKLYPYFVSQNFNNLEGGFILINKAVHALGGDVYLLMGICTFLFLVFLIPVILDYCRFSSPALFVLILFILFFFTSLNVVRQFVIFGALMWNMQNMYERKFVKFLIIILICSAFHKSALFILPFYFTIGDENIRPIVRTLFFIFLFLIAFAFTTLDSVLVKLPIIGEYFATYDSTTGPGPIKLGALILKLPIVLPIFFFSKGLSKYDDRNRMWLILASAEILLSFISYINPVFDRPAIILRSSWLILLPQIVRIQKSKRDQRIVGLYIILVCVYVFAYDYAFRNYAGVMPYESFR